MLVTSYRTIAAKSRRPQSEFSPQMSCSLFSYSYAITDFSNAIFLQYAMQFTEKFDRITFKNKY